MRVIRSSLDTNPAICLGETGRARSESGHVLTRILPKCLRSALDIDRFPFSLPYSDYLGNVVGSVATTCGFASGIIVCMGGRTFSLRVKHAFHLNSTFRLASHAGGSSSAEIHRNYICAEGNASELSRPFVDVDGHLFPSAAM